ncbi:hypothetical protein L6452_13273 [Arctium lappa]|uniref:Uncharacterized protein n=1 Tax=Arctium lappa TaxID=4217 RepID=A0ACB9CHP0_ARCLA|nr:hypothetical protein L6452_13273 [Arctium lappa]
MFDMARSTTRFKFSESRRLGLGIEDLDYVFKLLDDVLGISKNLTFTQKNQNANVGLEQRDISKVWHTELRPKRSRWLSGGFC